MLVNQRNEWKKSFNKGDFTDLNVWCPMLESYRQNRNTNSWRMSTQVEIACEYVLYLEGQLKEYKKALDEAYSDDVDCRLIGDIN